MNTPYDALVVVSFGGPEQPADVMPFLENVTRGRGIPRERLEEVAEHYLHFGGKSPINDQNRELIARLEAVIASRGLDIPVYFGNRNWQPYLKDTVEQMKRDGVNNAAAFITSAFGSYSGCRQYLEDIDRARTAVPDAPAISALPLLHDRLGFLGPMAENVAIAMSSFKTAVPLVFTAHSVPQSMADTSPYVQQLKQACQFVAGGLGLSDWQLAYQSRSGPPQQPWLEPDILDVIRSMHEAGTNELVVVPIGFISDHMEVLFDLDTEAADLCAELGMKMTRAKTVGSAPALVEAIVDMLGETPRQCAPGCCPPPVRPSRPS